MHHFRVPIGHCVNGVAPGNAMSAMGQKKAEFLNRRGVDRLYDAVAFIKFSLKGLCVEGNIVKTEYRLPDKIEQALNLEFYVSRLWWCSVYDI